MYKELVWARSMFEQRTNHPPSKGPGGGPQLQPLCGGEVHHCVQFHEQKILLKPIEKFCHYIQCSEHDCGHDIL